MDCDHDPRYPGTAQHASETHALQQGTTQAHYENTPGSRWTPINAINPGVHPRTTSAEGMGAYDIPTNTTFNNMVSLSFLVRENNLTWRKHYGNRSIATSGYPHVSGLVKLQVDLS